MDVNIWSTFKRGGRVASFPSEPSNLLPSQRLKQKYEKGFSLITTTPPKSIEQVNAQTHVREMLDILYKFSEMNSLSKDDVREILVVFEEEVFTDENYENILNRAKLLAQHGIIPEIIQDEPVGGAKYPERIRTPAAQYNAPVQNKRNVTQKLRGYINPKKTFLKTVRRLPPLPTIPRKDVQVVPDRTPEQKDAILSIIQNTIFDPKSMSKIIKIIFDPAAINIFTEEQHEKYRDIYEFGSVPAQCNNTIGTFDSVDESGKRKFPDCYICGYTFYEDKNDGVFADQSDKSRDELRPTCEHILPIIQAAFFLELYRPDINLKDPEIKRKLDLEYSWAHRCCNYEKGDISFMGTRIQVGNPVSFKVNERAIKGVLSGIANPSNGRVGLNIIQTQIISKPTWIDGRNEVIKSMMNDIVNYLNDKGNIGLLFALGYDKITSSERINQKFINAIGEAKKRIMKDTKIKLILDKETGKFVSSTVPLPVLSEYQRSLKM